MADDAGALLVRSGLVPSSALDEARLWVASNGGTLGEQLVTTGVIADEELTDFYRSRLLVPQVNPNTLARLPVRVVAAIPSDMAIELRAIPISLDGENNLTVAMSDPSDSHAVDEIAFFTGTYVVRAVATQMQIAWCLAHYYGHVTALGQRLLQPTADPELPPVAQPAPMPSSSNPQLAIPRTKGLTGKVDSMRRRAMAPVTPVPRPHDAAPEAEPPLRAVSSPDIATDGVPDRPRARSVSGEIRVPIRRAPSIRPAIPDVEDESGPVITVEVGSSDEDPTGPRKIPLRRKKAKSDPPELAARAGEVDIATGPVRRVDLDEPRIIIEEEPAAADVSGELSVIAHRDEAAAPATTIEVSDDTSVGVVIHEHYSRDSEPVLLDRKRPGDPPSNVPVAEVAADDVEREVLVLDARKPRYQRTEKRTQVGIGALPALTRTHRDTEAGGVPTEVEDGPTASQHSGADVDPTRVDTQAAPPALDDFTDETLAPPPGPASGIPGTHDDDNTSPHIAAPRPAAPRAPSIPPGAALPMSTRPVTNEDDDSIPFTSVMSAVELDDAIPERKGEMVPGHLERRKIDYDPVDDGWGPPGTTIPPPLLGAVPGSEDGDASQIPMSDVDSAPLVVAPVAPFLAASPAAPEPARGRTPLDGSGPILVRALEDATSRSIELIHALERTQTRDEVITLMSAHLAESHRVSGFFSIKTGELGLFSMKPQPEVLSVSTLRLDRPSTLQDVVGTRLPYRGPMLDDASRNFLASVLGACPPEILLVPIAIRERVVGVLFGEHRTRHTFDDQLALAARAAGMALERILKAKRG